MSLAYVTISWCDSRKHNHLHFIGAWDKKAQAVEAQHSALNHLQGALEKKAEEGTRFKVQTFTPGDEAGVQFADATENLISRKFITTTDKKAGELRHTVDVYSCPADGTCWVETMWGGQPGLNRCQVRVTPPEEAEIDGEIKEVDLTDADALEHAKKHPNKMGSGNKKKKTYAFHIAYQAKHMYPL